MQQTHCGCTWLADAKGGQGENCGAMLIVLPISNKDATQMAALLAWMAKLGGCKGHQALIVTHTNISFDQVIELRGQALQVFDAVELIGSEQPDTGWPGGSNALFWTAARRANKNFLWIEADCVPMRAGWLDEISTAYANQPCGFMGFKYRCTQPFLPEVLMSGVACYPFDVSVQLPFLKDSPRAWDVDGAEMMVKNGYDSKLFHHFYGEQNLPPTFVARKDAHSPVNAMTLESIPTEAALFHRNKDGTLIRLLERKLFPQEFREKIVVAFNVYAGDLNLALHHSAWLRKLAHGRRWAYKAVICHDPSCPVVGLNHLEANLRQCFEAVDTLVYPRPGIPTYPACANWAFQNVAFHMARGKSPWFWCESDLVVLRADWLDQLQAEYDKCSRSWMGPVVDHMFHLQGTSVYPADAATRMPRAMRAVDQAFDMEMKEETLHDRHDCGHLIHHVWTILNGQLCPVGGGQIPANATPELLSQIPKTCVATHRWKDRSVIDLLMSGAYKH